MKRFLVFAAAALTMAGVVPATAAEAQGWRGDRAERRWDGRDDRGRRYDRYGFERGRGYADAYGARGGRYWRDQYGRVCYRRSDGVRRCKSPREFRRDRRDRYW